MNHALVAAYVCPKCHAELTTETDAVSCARCQRVYPVRNGVPDFVVVDASESNNPFLHGLGRFLAPVYEGPLWFPVMLRLLGGRGAPSLSQLVRMVVERLGTVEGNVLDFATGTGTYGRHVARPNCTVFGIDISLEMIRRGQVLTQKSKARGMLYARADGEQLPFANDFFDACLLCGSLHIFADTLGVLREIGRTLKAGAKVVGTTVIHGEKGVLRAKKGRTPRLKTMKVFQLPELERMTSEAGFDGFQAEPFGCLLLFVMTKR